jgi:hypothetical protein
VSTIAPPVRRVPLIVLLVTGVALAGFAALAGGQSSSQNFFRNALLRDGQTTAPVKTLLRSDGGFVNPRVVFAQLTGDRRSDAVVLVSSGGAAGDVAVYVFSVDGARDGQLRPVYRGQGLFRASARVTRGVVTVRVPQWRPGDELCCPGSVREQDLRWDRRRATFLVGATRNVPR